MSVPGQFDLKTLGGELPVDSPTDLRIIIHNQNPDGRFGGSARARYIGIQLDAFPFNHDGDIQEESRILAGKDAKYRNGAESLCRGRNIGSV